MEMIVGDREVSVEEVFAQIYNSEINIRLVTDWDGGYYISTGSDYTDSWSDPVYGYTLPEALGNLVELIRLSYPDSQFVYWLDNAEVSGYVPVAILV